jgi:hypothetical protein
MHFEKLLKNITKNISQSLLKERKRILINPKEKKDLNVSEYSKNNTNP